MMHQHFQRLLNALAFANVGNSGEFMRLIEKVGAPAAEPAAPAIRPALTLPAAVRSLFDHAPLHLVSR